MLSATTEQLQTLLDECSFRFECGYNKPSTIISLEDKEEMVHYIWLHHVLFHPHAALEQFKRGLLETHQFQHLVKSYPKEVWGLLASSTAFNVTPQYLCDAFAVQYSINGSNNRTKEEAVVFMWYDYIIDSIE